MKGIKMIAVAMLFATQLLAQSPIDEAKKELDKENYFKAKKLLLKGLGDGSIEKNMAAYLLGNTYLKLDDKDSAKMYFKMLGAENKSAYGYLANGRIALLNNDKNTAKALFEKAAITSKMKNSDVLYQIGDAWMKPTITDLNEAIKNFEDAYKLDKQNYTNMLALGDAYLENNEGGKAMSKYESAADVNGKLTLAFIKIGRLDTRARTYDDAVIAYKKAIALEPDFALAHKELAEAYFLAKKYDLAKPEFKRYIELNKDDADAKTKFLSFLFSIKEYEQVASEGLKMKEEDPNNYVILRALAYANYELKRYKEGLEFAKIFWGAAPTSKVRPLDYVYTAKLATQAGDTAVALSYFKKALEADTANGDLVSDYGKLMWTTKRYYDAINTYDSKIAKFGGVFNDYYYSGRAKFALGKSFQGTKTATAQDSAKFYYTASDSSFAQITYKYPAQPEGFQYRAKINSALDPEMKGTAAKIFYDQFITAVEKSSDPTRYKRSMVDAYDYLGTYHINKKDNGAARGFFAKALELDPTDEIAKELIKGL